MEPSMCLPRPITHYNTSRSFKRKSVFLGPFKKCSIVNLQKLCGMNFTYGFQPTCNNTLYNNFPQIERCGKTVLKFLKFLKFLIMYRTLRKI